MASSKPAAPSDAAFRALLDTPSHAGLGPDRRPDAHSLATLDARLGALFAQHAMRAPQSDLIRALVFLWHDHLAEAHKIVQEMPQPEAAWIHAIMHRREPDYWNSKYWWRRVGKPAAFARLADEVTDALGTHERDLAANLAPGGKWDPFAFVDACEQTAGLAASHPKKKLLQSVQAVEFNVLLRALLALD